MRIVFVGTPEFSVSCLQALLDDDGFDVVGVVSQPDRRSGRGMKLSPSPLKKRALEAGLDVLTPQSLRGNPEALDWLKNKQPDVLVVVAFGMILPAEWLAIASVAPINVHASLLPRWRGAAPIERALLAGDTETGVCVMHMEKGLDTGGVYALWRMPIGALSTGAQLWESLSVLGAELLVETLPKIADGALQPVAQNDALSTYAAKLDNSERIIDWRLSAEQVDRQVRCFSPRPGARTQLDGRGLKVLAGEVCREDGNIRNIEAVAGSVLGGDDFCVNCGNGSRYRLLTVQPEGKKVMDAASFLRGRALKQGEILGVNEYSGSADG